MSRCCINCKASWYTQAGRKHTLLNTFVNRVLKAWQSGREWWVLFPGRPGILTCIDVNKDNLPKSWVGNVESSLRVIYSHPLVDTLHVSLKDLHFWITPNRCYGMVHEACTVGLLKVVANKVLTPSINSPVDSTIVGQELWIMDDTCACGGFMKHVSV